MWAFLGMVSTFILFVGAVVWFIRRRTTKRPFAKRTKKVMWASFALLILAVIFDPSDPANETAAKSEIQPLAEVEETDEEKEAAKEEAQIKEAKAAEAALAKEKESKAEEVRLAEEKAAAEKKAEDERMAAEKKAEEERAAAERAAAEQLALEQKAAEEKAAQEKLAAEQAAQEAAASAVSTSAANENFSNCTELRSVYPSGVPEGHAAYQSKMDRDKDGYACEA